MKKRRPRLLLIVSATLVVGIYTLNPSRTSTWDPRGRLLGFMNYRIPSSSMSPTLLPGDFILVNTFTYLTSTPQRRDVVVFSFSTQPELTFVKRVIGLEGDHIKLDGSALYVNGIRQDEPYVTAYNPEQKRANYETTVTAGQLFMLGDNRQNSLDSRVQGLVPIENVVGRVSTIWWSKHGNRVGAVWHNRSRLNGDSHKGTTISQTTTR